MKKQGCPCNSKKPFTGCCRPILQGEVPAPSPEALMRSRYTAFCKKNAAYLLATLAREKRAGNERRREQELLRTMASTQWLGLKVMDRGFEGETRGFVEFIAFFQQGTALGQLHERSVFVLENGAWYYLDGEILDDVPIARNQPCVCGSGLKFKRCHGR